MPKPQQRMFLLPRNRPNSLAEGAVKPNDPSVHIDIQIHIDSSATSEQIDQLFESMARHLYRREG